MGGNATVSASRRQNVSWCFSAAASETTRGPPRSCERVDIMRIGRRAAPITNPDKVIFPGDGITKGEMVEYYR